jgi:indole-3-glycerol phosphate synthase
VPIADLERRAAEHRPRGWAAALRQRAATGPAVIAEIKKASPSKGLIRAAFDPAWLARRYRAGGAAALSVLTDEPYFQGSLRNLEMASAAAPLPCLRKDFIVDEYQIVEARAHRADAILLIAAALDNSELKRLAQAARALRSTCWWKFTPRKSWTACSRAGRDGRGRDRREQSRPEDV